MAEMGPDLGRDDNKGNIANFGFSEWRVGWAELGEAHRVRRQVAGFAFPLNPPYGLILTVAPFGSQRGRGGG